MSELPEGWTLARFPVTVEVRDHNNRLVHAEPYGNGGDGSEADLKERTIRNALEKMRQAQARDNALRKQAEHGSQHRKQQI